MESITNQASLALILLAVAIALVAWFLWDKMRHSLSRMNRMMTHVGLDPDLTDEETLATMKAVTARCTTCNCEDYCERWLKDEVVDDNDFCPNAQTFEELKRTAALKMPTTTAGVH